MTTREHVRAAISDSYYEARNSGQTMEAAADTAAEKVMALFAADTSRTIPARRTDPATSRQATEEIKVRAGTQRAKLLGAFYRNLTQHIAVGLTDEQAADVAKVPAGSEFAKRCSELREAGLIEVTGETRKGRAGAQRIVSRISATGVAVHESLSRHVVEGCSDCRDGTCTR